MIEDLTMTLPWVEGLEARISKRGKRRKQFVWRTDYLHNALYPSMQGNIMPKSDYRIAAHAFIMTYHEGEIGRWTYDAGASTRAENRSSDFRGNRSTHQHNCCLQWFSWDLIHTNLWVKYALRSVHFMWMQFSFIIHSCLGLLNWGYG